MRKIEQIILLMILAHAVLFFNGSREYEKPIILSPDSPRVPKPLFISLLPPRRDCPVEYQLILEATARDVEVPIEVLESIAWVESRFDPLAESPKRKDGHRDRGMFQINSKYCGWYADQYNGGLPFDPMSPVEAATVAALYIRFLYERYGSYNEAIIAYNIGMTAVDRGEVTDRALRYLVMVYEEITK
jgi:soluble lytic murein transglycosylase-like protein